VGAPFHTDRNGSERIGVTPLLNHLIDAFSRLDDPRCASKGEHNLLEILIMAICGVFAGAESWEDIAL